MEWLLPRQPGGGCTWYIHERVLRVWLSQDLICEAKTTVSEKEEIMTRIEEINSGGCAGGWHAEELQRRAAQRGATMADQFRHDMRMLRTDCGFAIHAGQVVGFNVPAKAVKATAEWITYQFLDGSTAQFPNQKHDKDR